MTSNFDFIKDFDDTLWNLGIRIEKNIQTSPSAVNCDATTFLEHILKVLLKNNGKKYDSRKTFYEQVDNVFSSDKNMTDAFRQKLKEAYQFRNKIHADYEEIVKNESRDAVQLYEKLFYIARLFYKNYSEEYDKYQILPEFKPLDLDFSQENVEIRDFNMIAEFKYDNCIICGKTNHLNYSLYCHECSTFIDNANNFESIKNAFGKNHEFTKQELAEYGMPEGYIDQFLNALVREKLLKAKGIYYSINNMYHDSYIDKINDYITVGELITRFKEGKIDPSEIKKSNEYKQGSLKHKRFYQFYLIINQEIINLFEEYIIHTKNLWKSIENSDISQEQLKKWYKKEYDKYKRKKINRPFIIFNELLIEEYFKLKRKGIPEKEIRQNLNITEEIYNFLPEFKNNFTKEIKQITIELLSKATQEGKSTEEIIEYAGITLKEYNDINKLSDSKKDEYFKLRHEEIESRKKELLKYLYNYNLPVACKKAKITLEDVYEYYDEDETSQFHMKTTELLMDKYLKERRKAKPSEEVLEILGIKEQYLNRWLKRSIYHEFNDRNVQVSVDLIIKGLKQRKNLSEISKITELDIKTIKSYISLGKKGNSLYKPLSDYYESKIIPEKLNTFLEKIKTQSIRKAKQTADIDDDEFDEYYTLGKNGDEKYNDFYNQVLKIKKDKYIQQINKGKSHKNAIKESQLTKEEYDEFKDELDTQLRLIKFNKVLQAIHNNKNSTVAASKAGCSVDDIYNWYVKGKNGDEDYMEFYEDLHESYIEPMIEIIEESFGMDKPSNIVKYKKITKKDFECLKKYDLIKAEVININNDEDDDNSIKKPMGIVQNNEIDIEELKNQILK